MFKPDKNLFVFGYKVKPKPDNPDYHKVPFGFASVWIIEGSREIARLLAEATLLAEQWEIVQVEDEIYTTRERLTRQSDIDLYNEALRGPKLLVVKLSPGETQETDLN